MYIVDHEKGKVKTVCQTPKKSCRGKYRNWNKTFLGATSDISPYDLVDEIFEGGPDRALEFLQQHGNIHFLPNLPGTTIENVTAFYGVNKQYVLEVCSHRLRNQREKGYPLSRQTSMDDIVNYINSEGIRFITEKSFGHTVLNICDDKMDCERFCLPDIPVFHVYTPETVLALSVVMFVSRKQSKNKVAIDLVYKLMGSEYVRDAIKRKGLSVSQEAREPRQRASFECSKSVCPALSEVVTEPSTASDENENNQKKDKTEMVIDQVVREMKAPDRLYENRYMVNALKRMLVSSMKEAMREVISEMVNTK